MNRILLTVLTTFALTVTAHRACAADNYALDSMQTAAVFKISHLGLSWTYGRFNDVSGDFVIDAADPTGMSFAVSIKTESVDTGNGKRDGHLKSPDFFNAKQFPLITFKSTSVKAVAGGYDVTGDLTMHGVTKSINLPLRGGRTAEFPPGKQRTGFAGDLILRRGEFGMTNMANAIGDEVYISVSFEGTKK